MKKLIVFIMLVIVILFSCDGTTSPIIQNIPYDLEVTELDEAHINLTWNFTGGSIGDTIQYTIARKSGESGWDEYYDFVDDQKSFMDEASTTSSSVYAYKVKATNETTNISYPFSISCAYFSDQTNPTDLSLTQITQDSLLISWQDNATGEEGYILDKKITDGAWISPYARLDAGTTSYTDQIEAFESLEYRVYAYFGTSTTTAISDTLFTSLGSPSELELSKPDFNKVQLDWLDNSLDEDGFYIDRKLGELPWEIQFAQVDSTITHYIDDVDYPAATLQYRVYAYKGEYTSTYSEEESVNIHLNLIGTFDTDGDALDIEVSYLVAYVADNYNGIEVINCYSPDQPEEIANIDVPDRALSASLENNFLYVTSNSGHSPGLLTKVDLSDIYNPNVTGTAVIDGIPNGIYASGDHAYIAAGTNGLVSAYISSMEPVVISSTPTGGEARKVTIDSYYAYVTNGLDGFSIFNILNPAIPNPVSSFPATGLANNIAVNNGIACITNGEDGIDVFDVNSPEAPFFITNYQSSGFIYDVAMQDNYAYLIDKDNGIIVLDITDVNNPFQMGIYRMDTEPVSVYNYGSYLFVTDNEGLKIIQVRS